MSYDNLSKLYYSDKENYKEIYTQRFTSENSVKLDFTVGEHQAFFVQSDEVINLLYRIMSADKEILKISEALPPKALEQYSRKCLIDEIVITNNIEGVHSSRKEIGDALNTLEAQSEKKGKKLKFWGIVNKYFKLLQHNHVPLTTCSDIRDLYDELILEEVISDDKDNAPDGQIFRKGQTDVYDEYGKVIHRGKYPETEIITYMEKALRFLNDDSVLSLYRMCIFHYLIEYIHPFYDGNGRLGRFILSYCISQNLEPILAFKISQTIKENIKKYYKAFSVSGDTKNLSDLTPFLIMMLQMIAVCAEDTKRSLTDKLNRWNSYEALNKKIIRSETEIYYDLYSLLVQAALFSETGISSQELRHFLNVSYSTLAIKLKFFKEKNLLVENKRGNAKYYQIDLQILDALLEL